MNRNIRALASAACCVFAVACAGTPPVAPSATLSPGSISGSGAAQASGGSASSLESSAGLKPSALSQGMTDVTLANAGWTCIQPGNGLTLCAPPGTGVPPIPPAADGQATYDLMAFTLDHRFVHHIKFLRPDLYHGEPCLGGDPWTYLDFLNYFECIIPGRG